MGWRRVLPAASTTAARLGFLLTNFFLRRHVEESTYRRVELLDFKSGLAVRLVFGGGLPKLAREWCHRHAAAYLRAHPLGAQAARHALEPLVNLARLHIRDGKSDAAFQLLDALYKAVTSRADTVIDGLWQVLVLGGALDVVPLEVDLLSYEVPSYYGMLVATYQRGSA